MNHSSTYIDLHVKCRHTTLLEENFWENPHELALGQEILEITPKTVSIKGNIWSSSKLEIFSCKRNCQENEKTRRRLGKIFPNNIFRKDLCPEYVKKFQNLTVRKQSTQLKTEQKTWSDTSTKII